MQSGVLTFCDSRSWNFFTPTLKELMFYAYVLRSLSDGDLYIGSTGDLRKRIKEHNNRRVVSTRSRAPFILVYYEAYRVEKEARLREKNLKLRANAFNQLKSRIKSSLSVGVNL